MVSILHIYPHLFGVAEETFIRVTEQVLDAFISRIMQIINWPEENELRLVAAGLILLAGSKKTSCFTTITKY